MPGKVYKRDQVVGIINSVLGKIHMPHGHETLSHELTELKEIIDDLHVQLRSGTGDISRTHIPGAKDELDAIVSTTEQATLTIMESCEQVLEIMKGSDSNLYQQIETCIVKIFEACTFQDITGQRIKKVNTSLKQIDTKISSVLHAMEGELGEAAHTKQDDKNVVSLLNGPALPQNAVSQDDIDRLLAEFDSGSLQA